MKNIFITLLATVLLLTGCAGASAGNSEKTPAEPEKTYTYELSCEDIYSYLSSVKEESTEMMRVPDDMLLDFYGIDPADFSDGVFYISVDNLKADEFDIVKATGDDAAKRLEELLKNRLRVKYDEADGYSPEQAEIIKKSGVLRNGLYVALICSKDFDSLSSEYRDHLK